METEPTESNEQIVKLDNSLEANDDFDDDDEMFGGCGIDESLLHFNEQMFTMNDGI